MGLGGHQVQFGKNQERRWRFDKQDFDALVKGRRYVLYSAGDELIYLEEAAG